MAQVYRKSYKKDGRKLYRKKWYIRYRDPNGKRHDVPGYTDKKASETYGLQLERKAEQLHSGVITLADDHQKIPLAIHLGEFRTYLTHKGSTPKQVHTVLVRATRVMEDCKFLFPFHINPARVQEFLSEIRQPVKKEGKVIKKGVSQQTANFYLKAAKQFLNWMVRNHRLIHNPLSGLQCGNVRLDRRHDRRALTVQEIGRLLQATERNRKRTFRGLRSKDRAMLYQLAGCTGLRVSEIASLRPMDFLLESDQPTVRLQAAYTKNRQEAFQPLPPVIIGPLKQYLSRKRFDKPIWTGEWVTKAAMMIRGDLKVAGIPYKTNEGFADFHALRHSFITIAANSGAKPKIVQDLARHGDIRITMNRYAHTNLQERSQAVANMPMLALADTIPCLPPCRPGKGAGRDTKRQYGTEGQLNDKRVPTKKTA